MEMEAENNEDESYYMSNSPIRKNNNAANRNFNNGGIRSNNNGLSTNPSNFDMNQAGNQQNQQYQNHQYSPTSGGMNLNGGKTGHGKKSNNHLNTGYNQIMKSNGSSG